MSLILQKLSILLLSVLFASCSVVQSVGLNTTAGLVEKASSEILTEKDFELFRKAVPGNIKFVEGLYSLDPKNTDLLATLIKGYSGYAFAVYETEALADQYEGEMSSSPADAARRNYSKALAHGLEYLKLKGIPFEELRDKTSEDLKVLEYLDSKLGDKDLEAVLFTANSWGGLINLSKKDPLLVSQLPMVKSLFDWVCSKRPDFHHGVCPIFYGAYEAGRPRMLGGNPEKGREIFLKAIERYPENALIRVAFLQYYVIPLMDEELYTDQKVVLQTFFNKFKKSLVWRPMTKKDRELKESANLYNAVANERFKIIKKYENEFF